MRSRIKTGDGSPSRRGPEPKKRNAHAPGNANPRQPFTDLDPDLFLQVREGLERQSRHAAKNQEWLFAHMHPYFFITMREEAEALVTLAARLHEVAHHRKITLVDQERKLLVACLDTPGSLYDTLKTLSEREISYAEISHSYEPIPGVGKNLEVQRFEFERKAPGEISRIKRPGVPKGIERPILDEMTRLYPGFDFTEFDEVLDLLWLNNDNYVRISPPERIARVLRLYQQGRRHNGLFLDVERKETGNGLQESRLMFSVGNPPQKGFLTQLGEILLRLDIGVRRSYSLIIDTGVHPYFLGNFYVVKRDGTLVEKRVGPLRSAEDRVLQHADPVHLRFRLYGFLDASRDDGGGGISHQRLHLVLSHVARSLRAGPF